MRLLILVDLTSPSLLSALLRSLTDRLQIITSELSKRHPHELGYVRCNIGECCDTSALKPLGGTSLAAVWEGWSAAATTPWDDPGDDHAQMHIGVRRLAFLFCKVQGACCGEEPKETMPLTPKIKNHQFTLFIMVLVNSLCGQVER